MSSTQKSAITAIRIYQSLEQAKKNVLLSAFGFVSECKHSPTCSQYAIDQINRHGTILGSLKALYRLSHCW